MQHCMLHSPARLASSISATAPKQPPPTNSFAAARKSPLQPALFCSPVTAHPAPCCVRSGTCRQRHTRLACSTGTAHCRVRFGFFGGVGGVHEGGGVKQTAETGDTGVEESMHSSDAHRQQGGGWHTDKQRQRRDATAAAKHISCCLSRKQPGRSLAAHRDHWIWGMVPQELPPTVSVCAWRRGRRGRARKVVRVAQKCV